MKIKLSDGTEVDLEDPALKKAIGDTVNAAVEQATSGLEENRNAVLDEKKKIQGELNDLKKQLDGLDLNQVKVIMQRMANDEETKLIAEGKIDEVVQRRVDAYQRDAEAKIKSLETKLEETEGRLNGATGQISDYLLKDGVRSAASKVGLQDAAVEDAIFRAKNIFKVEDGKLVARDEKGNPLFGKDGKSPRTMDEWLDGMKETAPHWFAKSQGAGNGGNTPGGNTPGADGRFTLTREQAKDRNVWNQAKAEAAKAGATVTVVDQ